MKLWGEQKLYVRKAPPDRRRPLREALECCLGIVGYGCDLEGGDRERSQSQPARTRSNASVTMAPCSPPSTGSKLHLRVYSSLGKMS